VTGFLGSYLAKALVDNGHVIIGLKRCMSDTVRLTDTLKSLILFDVEDGLESLFEIHSDIELVIHAATSYGNQKEPLSEMFMTNVILPLKILELSSCNKGCVFVNTGTYFSKISGDYSYLSDYIFTKSVMQTLGEIFSIKNKTTFVNVQLEHMFGPKDGSQKFTSSVFQKLLSNTPLIELTAGEQERDFVYVDDVVEAYLSIINSSEVMGSREVRCFEVGSGQAHTIKDFVLAAQRALGSESELSFGALPYRENELMYSEANLNSLHALGWSCKYGMEAGIEKAIAYLRS